ncbi:MAG: hypothetical protein AB1555_00795 [Nitrospirota bacterium]
MSLQPASRRDRTRLGPSAAVVTACAALAVFCGGCARWTQLAETAPPAAPTTIAVIPAEARVPAVLHITAVEQNGAPLNPNADLDRRLVSALYDTGVFSQLLFPAHAQPPLGDRKHVVARLSMRQTVDSHAGQAAFKGFLIGASMFLATPLLPLEYDYEAQMTLDLQRWDGQIRQYQAASKGTAYYHLFGATPLAVEELQGQVTERCLLSLKDQLLKDAEFYRADVPPLRSGPVNLSAVDAPAAAAHQPAE